MLGLKGCDAFRHLSGQLIAWMFSNLKGISDGCVECRCLEATNLNNGNLIKAKGPQGRPS